MWISDDDISQQRFEFIVKELRFQNQLLYQLLRLVAKDLKLDFQTLQELENLAPRLSSIKVKLSGGSMPVGPLTISVGQTFTASVVGFDQNGAPFTGPIPTPVFAVDNSAVATVDPASGAGSGVSAGVANVSASLTSAEGLALSDTETVTVTAVASVLTSIKVSLDPVVASPSVRK